MTWSGAPPQSVEFSTLLFMGSLRAFNKEGPSPGTVHVKLRLSLLPALALLDAAMLQCLGLSLHNNPG